MINSEPLCKIILEGVCMNTCSNVILVQIVSLDLYETDPVLAGTAESAIGGVSGCYVERGRGFAG